MTHFKLNHLIIIYFSFTKFPFLVLINQWASRSPASCFIPFMIIVCFRHYKTKSSCSNCVTLSRKFGPKCSMRLTPTKWRCEILQLSPPNQSHDQTESSGLSWSECTIKLLHYDCMQSLITKNLAAPFFRSCHIKLTHMKIGHLLLQRILFLNHTDYRAATAYV